MSIYFTNKEGQFLVPCWSVLDIKPQMVQGKAYDAIRALPYGEYLKNDWRPTMGFKMVGFRRLTNALDPNRLEVSEKEFNAYFENPALIKALKMLRKEVGSCGIIDFAQRYQQLKNGLASGAYTAHHFSPLEQFSQTQAVALFCTLKDGEEGYINKKGQLGALSSALIFQNEKDAQAVINRSSVCSIYSEVQMVKLCVSVQELGPRVQSQHAHIRTDFSKSSIMDINALAEKKSIEQALALANYEQILQAYERLKKEAGVVEEKASSPRRKM